jgi:hypothetical protein
MTEKPFPLQIQEVLNDATDLEGISNRLNTLAANVTERSRRIGFVVGKITPNKEIEGETLEGNKGLLLRRTLEVSDLVSPNGIDVVSSALIPDSLEGRFPLSEFYDAFNAFIRRHVRVLYTTEGWKQSKGATDEVELARANDLDIMHYIDGRLETYAE